MGNRPLFFMGDTHGRMEDLLSRTQNGALLPNDSHLLVLGDFGLNYYNDSSENAKRRRIENYPFFISAIAGNHEMRPWEVTAIEYKEYPSEWIDHPLAGKIFRADGFKNHQFYGDGAHIIEGYKTLVIGGAYSVDKFYRLQRGVHWFESEQMGEEERKRYLHYFKLDGKNTHYDLVLTHTVPYNDRPVEDFLPFIDQNSVDNSMEHFLQKVKENISYSQWFGGHFHVDKEKNGTILTYQGLYTPT